jgi:hypothetical protein
MYSNYAVPVNVMMQKNIWLRIRRVGTAVGNQYFGNQELLLGPDRASRPGPIVLQKKNLVF